MEIAERGKVGSIIIDTDKQRYSFMVPPGCDASIDESERTISFGNKKSSLKIKWGDSYLGGLPDENTLQKIVLNYYPGGAILQSHRCTTAAGLGWYFDVKRVYSDDYSTTTRHAILRCKDGAFEIVLTASSPDFRSQLALFSDVASSFNVVSKTELKEASRRAVVTENGN